MGRVRGSRAGAYECGKSHLFATEAAYYWYPWLWQNGGELLSEDGTQILFNSDEGKEAAEFYVGLAE